MRIPVLDLWVIGRAKALLMGLALSVVFSSAFAGVPTAPPDALSSVEREWLNQRGQLRVGLVLQAPYAQFDRRAQVLSGANVDLVNLMAKTLQVELLWRNFSDQAELEKALSNGEIDFAPGLTQTPAGLRLWLYSDPYMRVPQLVVGERDGSGVVDLEKLDSQVRVAVRMPSVTADYLRANYSHLNLQGVPLERQALQLLLTQQARYAVIDEAQCDIDFEVAIQSNTWTKAPESLPAILVRDIDNPPGYHAFRDLVAVPAGIAQDAVSVVISGTGADSRHDTKVLQGISGRRVEAGPGQGNLRIVRQVDDILNRALAVGSCPDHHSSPRVLQGRGHDLGR